MNTSPEYQSAGAGGAVFIRARWHHRMIANLMGSATDIQAALTVIGQRTKGLRQADLSSANIPRVNSARANLSGTNLAEANLGDAKMSEDPYFQFTPIRGVAVSWSVEVTSETARREPLPVQSSSTVDPERLALARTQGRQRPRR